MRRSIATVSLGGSLEEKLAAAAAADFDGVELFEDDLVCCPRPPEDVAALARDLGLSIDLYQPFRDFEAVPEDLHRQNLRRAERKFEVMHLLGVSAMLVCSNVSPTAIDDDALAAGQLHALAELAAPHGIRIAYEALAWGRHVSDYLHSWRIVEAARHPNLGLCLDSFHVLTRDIDPIGIESIPGRRIFFVQLADAPKLPMHRLHWSRHHRCFPGQGDLDVVRFLGHVLAVGYDGPLSLEVFNDVFRQSDPLRMASDGMRSLIALGESPSGAATGWSLPPAPALRGFAFAEIVAGAEAQGHVEGALRSLGFAAVARHRTKPVRLWRQGEARVLVNIRRGEGGDAMLGAFAVESGDPETSADRARALLAPARPRSVGPGEAVMTEIAAPDGTSVFFSRTESGSKSSWIGDLEPDRAGGPDRPGAGLTRIDHLGLSHPFGTFEEAALFYRTVLGLRAVETPELTAPYGLRRAETLVGGGVRIALDTPLIAGGPQPAGALHHLAFATDDILASARALRELGALALPIPANYYDDLRARFDLDAEPVAALADHGVLYDRDCQGNEFFHLYTEVTGHWLFFEVVQRVGPYAGLGARNASIRMAAQRAAHMTEKGG
jgi:4-hydroxyphenylpyruvate dioxygenase